MKINTRETANMTGAGAARQAKDRMELA